MRRDNKVLIVGKKTKIEQSTWEFGRKRIERDEEEELYDGWKGETRDVIKGGEWEREERKRESEKERDREKIGRSGGRRRKWGEESKETCNSKRKHKLRPGHHHYSIYSLTKKNIANCFLFQSFNLN